MIDFHVHLIHPQNREDSAASYSAEGEFLQREFTGTARSVWALAGRGRLLDSMRDAGIHRCVAFGLPWRTQERCRADNEYVLDAARAHPDKIYMLAVFQPLAGASAVAEVERCLAEEGCLGLKIKARWQGHSLLNTELWRPFMDRAAEASKLVLVHVQNSLRSPQGDGPHELLMFARVFPRNVIVAAHLGAMTGMYYPYQGARDIFANLFFDTSLATAVPVCRAYAAVGLGDRLLFASDFPVMVPKQLAKSFEEAGQSELLTKIGVENPDSLLQLLSTRRSP